MFDIILWVAIAILWLSVSILGIRSMNEADNDAVEWGSLPLYWKIPIVLVGPILWIIFERHIFEKS